MIIKDVDVNYIDYGSKENPMVFLHGWGQNIEMMKMLGDSFSLNHRIIILDLPGFGKSSEPKYVWTLYDYADFLKEFLSKLDVSNPILVGHSFGGKIALLYSSMYEVSKLVCLASPFKKMIEKDSLKTKILKSAKNKTCTTIKELFHVIFNSFNINCKKDLLLVFSSCFFL